MIASIWTKTGLEQDLKIDGFRITFIILANNQLPMPNLSNSNDFSVK